MVRKPWLKPVEMDSSTRPASFEDCFGIVKNLERGIVFNGAIPKFQNLTNLVKNLEDC